MDTDITFETAVEIPLKFKYRVRKPVGGYRADYAGNSGQHRSKGRPGALIGTGRTRTKTLAIRRRRGLQAGPEAGSAPYSSRPAARIGRTVSSRVCSESPQAMRLRACCASPRNQHEGRQDLVLVHGRARPLPLQILQPVIVDDLSERERDVLRLAADLLSSREIGAELGISVHTVKSHLRTAFQKLGVHTRRDAIRSARENGLLDPLWKRCETCHGTGRVPTLETVRL